MTPEHEILYDRQGTVWINGINGLLARFSRFGVDIHSNSEDTHCIRCTHKKTTQQDWEDFKKGVKDIHGIDLDKELQRFNPFQ